MGAALDLTEAGVERDFVDDMGARLAPGKAAVIAEIDEYWQVPLDTRMEALGGNLLRQTRTQIEDAYAERAVEAAQRELAGLETERLAQANTAQTEKARRQAEKLQAKIDAAQRRLRVKEDELAAKARAVRDEGNKKIAMLEAQKATAAAGSKAVLDNRLADLRGEYEDRTTRLQEALQRRKAADATSAA
jgi:23S rRNA pseudoU1915 N3-methylase RlmH